MRLTTDMMKGKTVCGFLVSILVVGMVMLPFPAIERAEASTVTNVWVELSDDTVLNSTSTALEYIIHFTTTTALTGGVDTITVTFPDGTTEMAGEEGSGYAFTLPSSIDKTYVAVDPDGAATTTIGYTDCYTDPDVGTYRVRVKLPEDIAAGTSPYIKFETGAAITSASTKGTTYRVKVVTSQDTTAVYSEYFSLGATAVTGVGHLSGYPTPATVGSAAAYKFEFTVGASGALAAGSGTITVIFPSGTTVPASASKNQVQVDADGIGTSYSLTECTVHPTCHPDSRTVTLTVPQAVAKNTNVYVYFREGFGLVNPTTSTSTARVKVYTSAELKYTVAANTLFGVWGSGASDVFAVGYYDDDTMRHYDGTSWSSQTSGTSDTLYGVWGITVGEDVYVFTVGYGGTILYSDDDGSTWTSQDSGTTDNLYGVWGYASNDVHAVGYGGTILHYNGSTWEEKDSDTTNNLYGIWGSASANVFAVGASGTIVKYTDAWNSLTSGTTNNLYGVWEDGSSDVFAVGASGTIVYSANNGTDWSSQVSPTTNTLYSVWGTASNNVYAVGASGTILYSSDGSTWSSQTSPTTNTLYSVWGNGVSDVYAVGYGGTIIHYDGTSWTSQASHTTNGYSVTADTATKLGFANSSGTYSDDATMVNMYSSTIYLQLQDQYGNKKAPSHDLTASLSSTSDTGKFYSAVGSEISSATIPSGSGGGQFSLLYKDSVAGTHTITASVLGYTDATWTVTVAPAVSVYDSNNSLVSTYAPTSTSPVAEDNGYHGGDYVQNAVSDAVPGETVKLGDGIYEVDTGITVAKAITLQSVNGASSTTVRPTTDDLRGVWGSSSSDVFAVGYDGTIAHYNGSAWSSQTSSTTNDLRGVWGSSSSDVFAVGYDGTILHYNGTTWSSQTRRTDNNLYSVWGTSSSNVFAVGASGTILHYTDAWRFKTSGTTNTLYGVWGSGATDIFAVGASGTILHSDDGTSWSSQASGTTNTLYGVWGTSSSNVYAVGASGTILRSTDSGTTWSSQTSPTSNNLYGIWGSDTDDIFAVGASGTIIHYVSSWSSQASGTTNNLYGVWGSDASDVFAVGVSGTILHYNGTSWSSQTSPITTINKAIDITATGSATYGVTIDGITFERLRSGIVFNYGIYDSYADYITVQNCVFNYMYNRGIMLTSTSAASTPFTNGTISNNTFSNGGGSDVAGTDAAIDITASDEYAISGITISGNTITDQKGKGIYLNGYDSTYKVSSVSITSNTITNSTSYGIQGYEHTDTIAITSNTITGSYEDGIYVKGTAYTIKKNVVTGNIGDGIDVETTSASHLINYNDIYDNTGYGVNVGSDVSTLDAKYK